MKSAKKMNSAKILLQTGDMFVLFNRTNSDDYAMILMINLLILKQKLYWINLFL